MMRTLFEAEAALVSLAGVALWLAIGGAIRRNVYLIEREVVLSANFALAVLASLGIAVVIILRGVSAAQTKVRPTRLFVFVEAPLTLAVVAILAWIAAALQIVRDAGPANPVGTSDGMPVVLALVVNTYAFYGLTIILLVSVAAAFIRARRSIAA